MDEEEAELRSAQADLDALQNYSSRLTIILGSILLVAGLVTLAADVEFRLDRIAVVGRVLGWFGYLATFGGLVAILTFWINRRDRSRPDAVARNVNGADADSA